MWQLVALLIGGLVAVSAYPVLVAAQTATESTAGYDVITNPDGTKTWTGYKIPRLQDNSGNWKNYVVTEDQNFITVKTNWANTLSFDKVNCSYKVYDPGNIDSAPLLPAVSWTAKSAINGTNTWSPMSVNNQSCSVSVDQSNNEIIITSIKSQDKTEQYVVSTNNSTGVQTFANRTVLDQKITHTIKITDKIKETIEVYNSAPNTKLGATQTVNNPNIVLNGQQLNLASSVGQFFDRNWIESNQAKIFQVADSLNYDFDVGYSSLWGIRINTNSVSLDYNNSPGATNNLVIDPTYTNTASISGSNVTFTLSYPTLTGATVSSGDIDGTALSGAQITDVQSKINSATTSWTTTAINTYPDGFGSNGDATPNNGPTQNSSGKVGSYSWTFDGSNDYAVTTSATTPLSGSSAASISMWLYESNWASITGAGESYPFVDGNFGSPYGSHTIATNFASSVLYTYVAQSGNDGGANHGSFNVSGLSSGWHHFVILYDGSQSTNANKLKLYIDNSAKTLSFGGTIPTSLKSVTAASYIGKAGGYEYPWPGQMDELTLWTRVLSTSDISSLYNSGSGATPSGSGVSLSNLKSYYNFEQTSGNLINQAVAKTSNTLSLTYTTVTAPGAPTAVSGSAASATSVSLSWTAPSSNGGASITDYTIQYSSNSGSTWSTWTHTASTSTSQTVTGLSQGTSYIFRVAAVNSVGTGSYSSNSSSVTTWDVPGAPTAVSGSSTVNNQVALSWTAPASNGGTSITDYVIQYSSNSGSTWTTFADGTSTSTSATVTGLTSNTSYIFKVAAVNSVGTGSYSSNSASVLVRPTTPGVPTGLAASSTVNNQATLSWTAPADNGGVAITDYIVQYSINNSSFTTFSDGTSTSTSATITGLTGNTIYYFKVSAVNSIGSGSLTSSVSTTIRPTTPGIPTGLVNGTQTTSSVPLSWTAPNANDDNGISDYVIYYSTNGSTYSLFSDGTSSATSATVTGLNSNTLYYFKVAASNSITTGSNSSSIQVITVPNPPTALTTSSPTTSSLALSWTAPSGSQTTDYLVQYSINNSSWTTFNDGASTTTSTTITGLNSNTLYYFRVATVANPTSSYSSSGTGTTTPGASTSFTTTSDAVSVSLSWTAPTGNQTITDYVIQKSTNNSTFTTFSDGTSNSTSATVTGLLSDVLYYFRVAAVNSAGTGSYEYTSETTLDPQAVDSLSVAAKGFDFVDLEWDLPTLYGATVQGYQINYTSPYGIPNLLIANSTNSTARSFTISDLTPGTEYSFRIGVWTLSGGLSAAGNIANVTTYQVANYTIGGFDFESSNPNQIGIRLTQEDTENGKVLYVNYPNTYDMTCNFDYRFGMTNATYSNISGTAISSERDVASFMFNGTGSEVINVVCYDEESGESSTLTLTSTDFALLQQIQNFRNGTYGTTGEFGSLDLITVIVVFISMIGFNRLNPAAGIMFAVATMFGLAYFEIISPITSGVAIVVAVLFMLAVITTRRGD